MPKLCERGYAQKQLTKLYKETTSYNGKQNEKDKEGENTKPPTLFHSQKTKSTLCEIKYQE